MSAYLLIGWIFYLILAITRFKTYDGASFIDLMKGLILGVLLWPIAMVVMLFVLQKEHSKK
jgi:hypothetical protein